MGFADLTPQFRELVSKASLPDAKRRKTTRGRDEEAEAQILLNKEYLREAYNIVCGLSC